MRRITALIIVSLLCLPLAAVAQTDETLDPEFGGRIALGVDKKIVKGLHVSLEEELRMDDNFGSLNRLQTTVGLSYKIIKDLKVGIGYAMINPYSDSTFGNMRHRLMVDASYTLRFGDWRLTLKERFQLTHRTGDFNEYQNPANLMALKSRLTLKYKGLTDVTPYGYIELRNTLNAPVINATYNEATDTWGYYSGTTFTQTGEAGWFLTGFNGVYVNRLRGSLGVDWDLSRQHKLNFFILMDYVSDKEVDANAKGTKLKSYTRERGFKGHVGASYEFQF